MISLTKQMIRSLAVSIISKLSLLYHCFFPVTLTEAEKLFIKENKAFWSEYSNDGPGSKYVLVEHRKHAVIYLSNAAFGSIVAYAKNLRPLFVINTHKKTVQRQILESYPNATFVCLNSWRYFLTNIKAWFKAKKIHRRLQTPEELLKLKIDDMPVGDTIYDAVLSRGYATIQRIDRKVFEVLYAFLKLRYAVKDIIRRYPIEVAVISQLMGLKGGTFAKYLLKNNIEILNRSGSHTICIRKYRTLREIGNDIRAPLREYFTAMMNDDDGTVRQAAEKYLEQRFGGGLVRIDAAQAFHREKKIFTDHRSFCADYELDPSKPVVFVMLHAFNDCPHWNYPRKMLYLDYYQWFMHTLEIVKTVRSANWIFKEHPTQRFYPTKDLDVGAVMKQVNFSHIRFIDGQANFNTCSLLYIANALITGTGTAGLEFSTHGIPCILVGEGSYSGFGFTIEPQDLEEYVECLSNIDQLSPLSDEQIKAAKIMSYFYFHMIESENFYFCPRFEGDELLEWNPRYSEILWKRGAADFQDAQHAEKMRKQIPSLVDFICDDSRIQSVNLSRYAFLK
jgi:hypothetical protein